MAQGNPNPVFRQSPASQSLPAQLFCPESSFPLCDGGRRVNLQPDFASGTFEGQWQETFLSLSAFER
jgi:hypothetical protein